MSDIPPPTIFECGCVLSCRVVDGRRETVLAPCRPDCPIVRLTLEESSAQSVPIEYRRAP